MKKQLSTIKHYPSNFELFDTNGNYYHLSYDGLKGELTESEWRENEIIQAFDNESQDKIIDTLRTYEVI